jgi:CBS domain-containing membrane protein
VGIVTLTDFLHHAGLDGPATLGERLRALLRPSGRSHSLHPEVAGRS